MPSAREIFEGLSPVQRERYGGQSFDTITPRQQRNVLSHARGFDSYSQQGRLGYFTEKRGGQQYEGFRVKGTEKQQEARHKQVSEWYAKNRPAKTVQVRANTARGFRSRKQVKGNELGKVYGSAGSVTGSAEEEYGEADEEEIAYVLSSEAEW